MKTTTTVTNDNIPTILLIFHPEFSVLLVFSVFVSIVLTLNLLFLWKVSHITPFQKEVPRKIFADHCPSSLYLKFLVSSNVFFSDQLHSDSKENLNLNILVLKLSVGWCCNLLTTSKVFVLNNLMSFMLYTLTILKLLMKCLTIFYSTCSFPLV